MKKLLTLTLILTLLAVSVTACTKKAEQNAGAAESIPEVSHSEYKKICDNLYEVTYDEYDIDYSLRPDPEEKKEANAADSTATFGCSSVHNGNFYGRSFDYTYKDSITFVVRTTAKEGRYASIGIVPTPEYVNDKTVNAGLDADSEAMLPLAVVDGINEKGVVCNINVVPVEDIKCGADGTNPGKPDLNLESIIRFVLDNAASAAEAVELLKERNILVTRDFCGITKNGLQLHLMVADADETYVVEFVDNKMNVLKDQKIMTNYYLSLPELTGHSCGVERYKVLEENYDMGNTFEGMAQLMEKVRFTDSYQDPIKISDVIGFGNNDPKLVCTLDNVEEWRDNTEKTIQSLRGEVPNYIAKKENPLHFWITMHMTTYDIENRTMRIIVQERYDDPYVFELGK